MLDNIDNVENISSGTSVTNQEEPMEVDEINGKFYLYNKSIL